eukprot:9471403-Pyramimonas_sp.AAC.1
MRRLGDIEDEGEDEYAPGPLRSLAHQLEARMRAIEHAGFIGALLDRNHPCTVESNAAFQRFLANKKTNPEDERGAPACQSAFAVLADLSNFAFEDISQRRSACE